MNDQLKEVRATLDQVRELMPAPVTGPHVNIAIHKLADSLDVLTGEVERLHTAVDALHEATIGLYKLMALTKKFLTGKPRA